MVRKNIKLRVKNLVRKMGTASPLQIADMMRIPIVYAELPKGIRGYLTRPLRRKVIVLNDKLDEREIPIVVAHELGHAIQYSQSYFPMRIRSAIIPITNIGSNLSFPLVILGLIFSYDPLVTVGIFLYLAVVLFQLVTLPVEFNASARALRTIEDNGWLFGEEQKGAKRVLTAAALTYVAALFTALMNLFRLIAIANRRRD